MDIPFIIHAPHFREGVNLAVADSEKNNVILISEAQRFADKLRSPYIIIHPGIAGHIEETAIQINKINEKRFLIENKPYYALDDGLICNGASFEDIKYLKDETGAGFCFDFGHAICAANAFNKDVKEYLQGFMNLFPVMYHLSDGDHNGVYDKHEHIGKGSFDIRSILETVPDNSMVTVETKKDSKEYLSDFIVDIDRLKNLAKEGDSINK